MKTVLCAGEILYDFISTTVGAGLAGSSLFEKKPGGSPFNIAVGTARLGLPTAFLVKLGTDEFGQALRKLVLSENISPKFMVEGAGQNTTLAMAALDKAGVPEFRFYRDNAADVSLEAEEIPEISPDEIGLFQFGSISLATEPAATAYLKTFRNVKKLGITTSLDPNIRPNLVNGNEGYAKRIRSILGKVDILKMSDADLFWLTGKNTLDDAIDVLPRNKSGILVVTEGSHGATGFIKKERIRVAGYPVTVAETTGCGDSFMAGFIAKFMTLTEGDVKALTPELLKECMRYANACAAIVATRFGAANSMPKPREVAEFLTKRG